MGTLSHAHEYCNPIFAEVAVLIRNDSNVLNFSTAYVSTSSRYKLPSLNIGPKLMKVTHFIMLKRVCQKDPDLANADERGRGGGGVWNPPK